MDQMQKYMIEVKAANQVSNEEVIEKADAGIKWCEYATKVDADKKVWIDRLIPGEEIEIGNTFKYTAGRAIAVDTEE